MSETLLTNDFDSLVIEDADIIQLVGMKLGDEEYAIDVLKIQEIIRTVEITIVPRSDAFVLGVMNLRGKVIPVIDLRVRFNLEKVDFDKSTRIIVVRFEKENIGFVVDEVTQVIRISKSMVEPTPPLVGAIGQEYILGICKYYDRLIILLDIDRVVGEGNEHIESDLRKRFTEPKDRRPKQAVAAPAIAQSSRRQETAAKQSMADEVKKPLISAVDDDDDNDNAINAVLKDAVQQSKMIATSATPLVEQGELDSLIAAELAKREVETDELNKKRKQTRDSAENALSVDDLIAAELFKREAETEELNKKKRAGGGAEKKNKITRPAAADINEETVSPQSMNELKDVARKIISGESRELSKSVKGEMGELLRLLMDIKSKVDDISPNVLLTQNELPGVSSTLNDVNNKTEKAAFHLLENAQKLSDFYKLLLKDVDSLGKSVNDQGKEGYASSRDFLADRIDKASDLGLYVLEALEFQDITEQKLRKVILSIEDVGARLGAIVGFMRNKDGDNKANEDYDSLLSDLGFA